MRSCHKKIKKEMRPCQTKGSAPRAHRPGTPYSARARPGHALNYHVRIQCPATPAHAPAGYRLSKWVILICSHSTQLLRLYLPVNEVLVSYHPTVNLP